MLQQTIAMANVFTSAHEEKALKPRVKSLKICGVLGGMMFKNPQPTAECNVDQEFNAGPLVIIAFR